MPSTSQNVEIASYGDDYALRGAFDNNKIGQEVTLTGAIDAALSVLPSPGGQIHLQPGTYHVQAPLDIPAGVELVGSGRATELTVDPGLSAGIEIHGKDDIAIRNLTVLSDGAEAGIILSDCGGGTLENVTAIGFEEAGIWLRDQSFLCTIVDCLAAENAGANIRLQELAGGTRAGDFVPNRVHNCKTVSGGIGIECERTVVENLTDCTVYQPHGPAFLVHGTSNSVLISGCRSFQGKSHAVKVVDSHEIAITGNIFCWHWDDGIVLDSAQWGTVTGNEIIDSGEEPVSDSADGVVMTGETKGISLVGNAIFNWGSQGPMVAGIREGSECLNNLIDGNNINFCSEAAVISEGEGTLVGTNIEAAERSYRGMGAEDTPLTEATINENLKSRFEY